MSRPRVSLIAALDRNGVIGYRGGMPWHIPGDLRWFRQQTMGTTLLMGRKTFDSIGRALPGRTNLVMTRQPDWQAEGVQPVADLATARAQARDSGELMVIGGAEAYTWALPEADRLLLTHIEADYRGDTWFPDIDWHQWRQVDVISCEATGQTPAFHLVTWVRIGNDW